MITNTFSSNYVILVDLIDSVEVWLDYKKQMWTLSLIWPHNAIYEHRQLR